MAGKRNGKYTSWYSNKNVKIQGEYSKDQKIGKWISYYENGNKEWEGFFKNDKRDSSFHFWFRTGDKFKESYYTMGYDSVIAGWDKKKGIKQS